MTPSNQPHPKDNAAVNQSPSPQGPFEQGIPGVVLGEVLGRGGFATVYAGEQTSLRRQVAVKIDSRPLDSERDRRRFVREMSAASRISGHPHVVTLIDAGVLPDGRPYLVMERCDGGSLAGFAARNPMPAAEAVRLIEAVSGALGAAHAAGVLHRDIKPGNILLDSYGSPRLSDFGIAAIQREEQDASVTLEALTPAFAPPEAFNMAPPTAAGDVWSMGAVLLALVTGRGPRTNPQGRGHSLSEIYQGLALPVDTTNPLVPVELRPIIAKAMDPLPERRYRDGAELAAALRTVLPRLTGAPAPSDVAPTTLLPEAAATTPAGALAAPAPPVVASPRPAAPQYQPQPTPVPANAAQLAHQQLLPTKRTGRVWPWVVAGGLAVGALATTVVVLAWPALSGSSATATAGATTSGATTPETPSLVSSQAPSPSPSPSASPSASAEVTASTPEASATPSQVNENGIPYSPDMPWALGTCMRGWVDDQGISSSMEVSCDQANWTVFAGGDLAEDNPATNAEEALNVDTQIPVVCSDYYAKLFGIDTNVPHEIKVLGPLDDEWAAGERGFSCVFAEL